MDRLLYRKRERIRRRLVPLQVNCRTAYFPPVSDPSVAQFMDIGAIVAAATRAGWTAVIDEEFRLVIAMPEAVGVSRSADFFEAADRLVCDKAGSKVVFIDYEAALTHTSSPVAHNLTLAIRYLENTRQWQIYVQDWPGLLGHVLDVRRAAGRLQEAGYHPQTSGSSALVVKALSRPFRPEEAWRIGDALKPFLRVYRGGSRMVDVKPLSPGYAG